MSNKISAGILLYRRTAGELEFFLVHPGGPHNARKDVGVWSVPKGEIDPDDGSASSEMLNVAKREFFEETSMRVEDCVTGKFIALAPVKLKSGKTVHAWAVEGDIDADKIVSNTFLFEWPPRSGKKIEIPEVDKGAWFTEEEAKVKINAGQVALIEEVVRMMR